MCGKFRDVTIGGSCCPSCAGASAGKRGFMGCCSILSCEPACTASSIPEGEATTGVFPAMASTASAPTIPPILCPRITTLTPSPDIISLDPSFVPLLISRSMTLSVSHARKRWTVDSRVPRVSKVGKTRGSIVMSGRERDRDAVRSVGNLQKVSSVPCNRSSRGAVLVKLCCKVSFGKDCDDYLETMYKDEKQCLAHCCRD